MRLTHQNSQTIKLIKLKRKEKRNQHTVDGSAWNEEKHYPVENYHMVNCRHEASKHVHSVTSSNSSSAMIRIEQSIWVVFTWSGEARVIYKYEHKKKWFKAELLAFFYIHICISLLLSLLFALLVFFTISIQPFSLSAGFHMKTKVLEHMCHIII